MVAVAPRKRGAWIRLFFGLVVIVVLAGAVTHWNAIYDWLRLRNYTPPAAMSQLASDDTMTPYATHLLYVNHPTLQARSDFSSFCPSGTEQTVVLGCYKSTEKGIYVLKVTNAELAGIEQVTTAHEMLHAAYDRLSNSERTKVDAMLTNYYQTGLHDATIKNTIAAYKKSEPNAVVNEMHSVFGTEVAPLPSGLETYYQKYFTNRAKVTGYYQTYEAAFTSRQQQIAQYDSQLKTLKPQIDQLQSSAQQQQTQLQSQRSTLDTEHGSVPDQTYNADVMRYNSGVNTYNANVRQLQSLIAQYNQIVADRNNIALEEQQLTQAITAAPKQLAQ